MTDKEADILCYILAGMSMDEFVKKMIKEIGEKSSDEDKVKSNSI